ncbi:hypothetical protein [Saccharopolyspora sp. NPDC049357]
MLTISAIEAIATVMVLTALVITCAVLSSARPPRGPHHHGRR